MTTPLKIEFSDAYIKTITELADSRGITATSAVHRAITTEAYIHGKQKAGTRFIAIDLDGSQYVVSF